MATTKETTPNVESNAVNTVLNTVAPLISGMEKLSGIFDQQPVYDTNCTGMNLTNVPQQTTTVGFTKDDLNTDHSRHFSSSKQPSMLERLQIPGRLQLGNWTTTQTGVQETFEVNPWKCYLNTQTPTSRRMTAPERDIFDQPIDDSDLEEDDWDEEIPPYKVPHSDPSVTSTATGEATETLLVPQTDLSEPTFMGSNHMDFIELLKRQDLLGSTTVSASAHTASTTVKGIWKGQTRGGFNHHLLEACWAYFSGGSRIHIFTSAAITTKCLMAVKFMPYETFLGSDKLSLKDRDILAVFPGMVAMWHLGHEPIKTIEVPQYSLNRVIPTVGTTPYDGQTYGSGYLGAPGFVELNIMSRKEEKQGDGPDFNLVVTRSVMEDYRLYFPLPAPMLFNALDLSVSPKRYNGFNLTMLQFLSQFYHFWRGSLVYEFEFFPSAFHQGQVYIAYCPYPGASTAATAGTITNLLGVSIDLSKENKASLTIPYTAPTEWKKTSKLDADGEEKDSLGKISIWVQNQLTRATTAVADSIDYNVSISAGPDFRFAVPKGIGQQENYTTNLDLSYFARINNDTYKLGTPYKTLQSGGKTTTFETSTLTSIGEGSSPKIPHSRTAVAAMDVKTQAPLHYDASSDPLKSVGNMEAVTTDNVTGQAYWTAAFDITTSQAVGIEASEWGLAKTFFEDTRAPAGLMKYHEFFRGDFEITVRMAATKFHQGCIRILYQPPNSIAIGRAVGDASLAGTLYSFASTSQLPHMDINLCEQTEGKMIVPWSSMLHMIKPSATEGYGFIKVMIWNQLKTGTGGATTVHGSLWIRAINPNVAVKTLHGPTEKTSLADYIVHIDKTIYCLQYHVLKDFDMQLPEGFEVLKRICPDLVVLKGPHRLKGCYNVLAASADIFSCLGKPCTISSGSKTLVSHPAIRSSGKGWMPGYEHMSDYPMLFLGCDFGRKPGDCGSLTWVNGKVMGIHASNFDGETQSQILYREMFEPFIRRMKDPFKDLAICEENGKFRITTRKDRFRAVYYLKGKAQCYGEGPNIFEAKCASAEKYLMSLSQDLCLRPPPQLTEEDVTDYIARYKSRGLCGEQMLDRLKRKMFGVLEENQKSIAELIFGAISSYVKDLYQKHKKRIVMILNGVLAIVTFLDFASRYCAGLPYAVPLLSLGILGINSYILAEQCSGNILLDSLAGVLSYISKAAGGVCSFFTSNLVKSTLIREGVLSVARPAFKTVVDAVVKLWRMIFPSQDVVEKATEYVKNDVRNLAQMRDDFTRYTAHSETPYYPANRTETYMDMLERLNEMVVEREAEYMKAKVRTHEPMFTQIKATYNAAVLLERNNKTRPEPLGIFLSGKPGAGKSTCVNFLANCVLKRTGLIPPEANAARHVYRMPTDPKQDYFDGYADQPVAVYDDAFAGSEAPEAKKFINMISEGVCQLNMASMSEKGKTFKSPFIILTSNAANVNHVNELSFKDAFVRRFPHCFQMAPTKKYGRKVGHDTVMDKAKLTEELGKCRTFDQAMRVMDEAYNMNELDLSSGALDGRTTFSRVVEEITDNYMHRTQTFNRSADVIKSIQIRPKEALPEPVVLRGWEEDVEYDLGPTHIEQPKNSLTDRIRKGLNFSSKPNEGACGSSVDESRKKKIGENCWEPPITGYPDKLPGEQGWFDPPKPCITVTLSDDEILDILEDQETDPFERLHWYLKTPEGLKRVKRIYEDTTTEDSPTWEQFCASCGENWELKEEGSLFQKHKWKFLAGFAAVAGVLGLIALKYFGQQSQVYGLGQQAYQRFCALFDNLVVKGKAAWEKRIAEGRLVSEKAAAYQFLFKQIESGQLGYNGKQTIPYYILNPSDSANLILLAQENGTYDPGEHAYWDEILSKLEAIGEQSLVREVRRVIRKPIRPAEQGGSEEHPLMRNRVLLYVDPHNPRPSGMATFLNCEWLLLNNHYRYQRVTHAGGVDIVPRERLYYKLGNVMHPIPLQDAIQLTSSECGELDAAVIKVPAVKGIRDYTSQFMTKEFYHAKLKGTDVAASLIRWQDQFGVVVSSDEVLNPSGLGLVHHSFRVKSAISTDLGDCGSLYIYQDKCLGIHCNLLSAAEVNLLGMTPIFKEDLLAVIQDAPEEYELLDVYDEGEQGWDGDAVGYERLGQIDGVDGVQVKVHTVPKSDFVHSAERDTNMWPDGNDVAPKSDKILKTRSLKYGYNKPYDAITQEEREFVKSLYFFVFSRHPDRNKNVLSWEEVLNGTDTIQPLRLETSAGSWGNQAPNKAYYVDKTLTDTGNLYEFHENINKVNPRFGLSLRENLCLREEWGFQLKTIPVYWQATLKDEILPIEKVEAGKTRVFEVPPVDSTLLFKRWLGAFGDFYRTHPGPVLSHTIGTDREAIWGLLYAYLKSYNPNRVISADYSQFDGSINPYFFSLFDEVVHMYYDQGCTGENNMRRCLINELKNTYMLVSDSVMQKDKGNCSGNYLTDVFNSFVNLSAWMIAFYRTYQEVYGRKPTLQDWFEEIILFTHGDDCIGAIRTTSSISSNLLVQHIKDLGFYMTPADKREDGDLETPLESTSYLKSGFRKEGPVIWPFFSKTASYKEMNWVRKKWKNDLLVRKCQWEEASKFAAYVGRDFKEEFDSQVRKKLSTFDDRRVSGFIPTTYSQHFHRLFQLQQLARASEFAKDWIWYVSR